MKQPSKSLVLFDIDGTLMRGAGPHHIAALIEGIRKVTGHSTNLDGIPTAGKLDRDLIVSMLVAEGATQGEIKSQLPSIMRECQSSYISNCSTDLAPFVCRGVREKLAELASAGAVLALVTGNLSEIGWKKVELAGLKSYFSTGAFAEDGRTRARLAQIAWRRAQRAGLVTRNCRISLIGDHANDIAAAKANDYQSVAVASGVLSYDELAKEEPDILIRHMDELDLSRVL